MSYRRPDTGNSMNDYFSSLVDFTVVAPRLLEAATPEDFNVWLEKLELIDRRPLLRYIRKHKDRIPKEHLDLARKRFVERI